MPRRKRSRSTLLDQVGKQAENDHQKDGKENRSPPKYSLTHPPGLWKAYPAPDSRALPGKRGALVGPAGNMQRAARAGSLEGEKRNREPRAPQRAYPAPTLHLPYTYLPTYRPSPAHQHLSHPAYPAPTLHPAALYDSLDQVALVGSPQPAYPAPLPRRLRLGERLGDETQDLPASRLPQPTYPAPAAGQRGAAASRPHPAPNTAITHAHNTRTHAHTHTPSPSSP